PLPPKFALVKTPVWEKADASTREIFEELISSLGDDGGTVELPEIFAEAWTAHRTIMAADMAHRLSKLVERGGPDKSSQQLRDILDEGRRVTAVDYLAAHDLGPRLHASLSPIFDYYDAIITPASIGSAPASLETTGDPVFCTLWTLLGVPALSLPVLQAPDGMPLGLQLVGPPNDDARLLRSARVLIENLSKLES
ncbi:MAG: amidase family protein, partial [Pseudomonadota bacterium]